MPTDISLPPEPKANILLVDDQPANLLALQAILEDLGQNLVTAYSGEDALRRLLDQDFAVVLLDVWMHGFDGFETAKLIRSRERSRHTPIIFLTAHDGNSLSVEEAYSLGAVDYLVKPLVPVILRAKVAGFIELFQKTEQVRRQADLLRQVERGEFEKKLAEENARLRESEARKAAILKTALDCIITMDHEGKVLEFNPAAERTFGYRRAEVIGQEMCDLIIPPGLRDAHRRGLAQCLATGEGPVLNKRIEMTALRADGTEFPVELAIIRIPVEGTPLFTGHIRDITERKRSETRLRLLGETVGHLLVADAPDAMVRGLFERIKDHLGVDTYFNFMVNDAGDALRLESCAGIPEETARSMTRLEFGQAICGTVALHRRPIVATFIQQSADPKAELVRGFGIRAYASNPLMAGGRLLGTLSFASRTRDQFEDEELKFLQTVTHYVTLAYERVRLIQRLRESDRRKDEALASLKDSEQQFRTLADSIPQLAWTARPDGHIYWYNRRWYEYTGTTLEQMQGWGWQSVHDPAELPKVLERWRASIATGEPFDMVLPLRGADGRFRPFLTRVLPLRSPDGRILQWFGTNTDITEIKKMEEALKEVDRRKDEFLAMLAHELRNPLAPIRNGLQIIQMPDADAQIVEQARRMMERQVHHLSRIVDDLLDVSRIQRGKVSLRRERLDLARLVRFAAEDQRPEIERAGLSLELDLPETPVWVLGDSTRLTQVFCNLVQNATKFTHRGGRVTICVAAEEGRKRAVLSVRDTGVGIDPEMLPRLFETFAQADRSLDRSKGGLGLGLALVRGLIELHGGGVHAGSAGQGLGAEFVVWLPLQPEPAAVTEMPTARKAPSKRLRILVVEDNRDAADSLRMLLGLFGYDVAVAYSGPEGVKTAEEWHPDVILCDIGLPGMDGYVVAEQLRRNPITARARMIAVTGYGSDEDRRRSREAGFDEHLTKPVDPATLQEVVAGSN